MTAPVVNALVDSGLFRLLVPHVYGGLESDIATIIDVCEELAFADGSVGWAFAQNTTVMAYAAYLAPEYARTAQFDPADFELESRTATDPAPVTA